ncbi:MAG TPA: helix-turn-helix domain-containing protein [Stackebrandtia sp.]|jgi:AraC family transcriptional activator FtrA|uniref:helix-turn-helix domain-containing protein n=1 Tax=Stackebrandtia sp. TaxID=2023065 RepID=UPI002D6DB3B1|nr:helix-turn-helix domain-containing protein [Stackebrandtia sp.]HZE39546.1 helix-turn-helix domain-containing protein [Stackebrandtia sp.]
MTDPPHVVSVLLYDSTSGFTAGIVAEIFGRPAPAPLPRWYELRACVADGDAVDMVGGARLSSPHGLDDLASADTVIVPGVPHMSDDPSPRVVAALRRAHRRGARLVSICSGAYALAATGLLDGRRVATHWGEAAELRRRHPSIVVDRDVLYIDDGDILTGAGHAAGLDLCLHLVRADHGAEVANQVARRLVIPPHREGGQAQFVEAPVAADLDDDRLASTMDWAERHLTSPITVTTLASRAHMSTRNFQRLFTRATGTSPIRWLITRRVHASLPLLETTSASVEEIGAAVGFDTAVSYRHHFGRLLRTSPSAYRKAFHAGAPSAGATAA